MVSECIAVTLDYRVQVPFLALSNRSFCNMKFFFHEDAWRFFIFFTDSFLNFVWWNHHDFVWQNQNSVWNLMDAFSRKWCHLRHQTDTQLTKMLHMMKRGNFVWQSPGLHIIDPIQELKVLLRYCKIKVTWLKKNKLVGKWKDVFQSEADAPMMEGWSVEEKKN